MKKQTYISYLEDGNQKMIDFERWSHKRVETILSKLSELYKNPFYQIYMQRAETISIYATPDGYNRDRNPILRIPVTEIV
jgi:hypothetical protein